MDKLQDKLNKIDNIINQIEKNNSLKKSAHGDNLKTIIEMNKRDKLSLNKKLDVVEKFSSLLENIIKNKPRPETLDKELVNYIGYDDKKTSR
jgi:hypothetical protein